MTPDRWTARAIPRLVLAAVLVATVVGVPAPQASEPRLAYGPQDDGEMHVDCGSLFGRQREGCAAGATCAAYDGCASGNCQSGSVSR